MRVIFHAINGVGLGHLTRTAALAVEVRALGHEVIVLSSAADTSLLRRAGLDHIRLPPRLGEPHASPERSLQSLDEQLERDALAAVLDALAADLVVFDTHPPTWLVHRARNAGARVALVLRELRPQHRDRLLQGELALLFDRILVPHERSELDERIFPWFLPVALEGPVVRSMELRPTSAALGRPLLVITAGGGGQPVDTRRFFQAAADAHWLLRGEFPTLETVLIQGPYGRPPARLFPGLRALPSVPDLAPWLLAADLVISQAGYNTIQELRALRVPAILVPGHRRAEDQKERARRLARAGAAVLASASASALADAAGALLRDPSRLDALRNAHAPPPPRNREAARWLVRERPASSLPRILLIAHHYPPRIGGMETSAHQLALGLARQGHPVTVYTQSRLGVPVDGGVNIRKLYTSLGPPLSIDLWSDLLLTIAAAERDRPDIVHLCNAGLAPWVPYLRVALGCPVTVQVHGNDLIAPWTRHGLDEPSLRRWMKRGLTEADSVIAVSEFSASLASLYGVTPRVILGGVDSDFFCPDESPRNPWILTVSRMAPRKGHSTVIRALPTVLRSCPEARFVFTGENEAHLAELRAQATSLGVEHALMPVGRVGPEELRRLYRASSVFALVPTEDPSDVEGFGLVLLEAASCGLPVIAGQSGGTAEAAQCVGGTAIPSGNPEILAQTILAHFAQIGADSPRARELARAHTWATSVAAHRAVFSSLEALLPASECPEPPDASPLSGASAEALEALRFAPTPPALREASRRFAAARWREREGRIERHRWALSAGKTIQLRATSAGKHRLAEALEDCAALNHKPALETRLSAALEPSFLADALPWISGLHFLHTIPSPLHARLIERLPSLFSLGLPCRCSLRLFWSNSEETPHQEARQQLAELAQICQQFNIHLERSWEAS